MFATVSRPRLVTTDGDIPPTGGTFGDYLHHNIPDWKEGSHIGDPMLRDMWQWNVEKVQQYKSDMLPKGTNTIASGVKRVIAPVDTANTDTAWIEHDWVVAKVTNPAGGETMWIASWKDFKGNIVTEVHRTLGAANRAASSTKGDSAGKGIRTKDESHKSGFTVDQMLGQIQSIKPIYHTTQCNCQGYANEMFSTFKAGSWSSNELNMDLWTQPKAPATDPSEDRYTTKESGLPGFRTFTVSKNEHMVGEFSGRLAADKFIRDDQYRSQQLHNTGISSTPIIPVRLTPTSPPWNMGTGLVATTAFLGFLAGPIGAVLGKFFVGRQEAKHVERCEEVRDDTQDDIDQICNTTDAYIGNVEKLCKGEWVEGYDCHSVDNLISCIPKKIHNLEKRVGEYIDQAVGNDILEGYQVAKKRLEDDIRPSTFYLQQHFNDTPDQLIGAIQGCPDANAKNCLTRLFGKRWGDFMTANIDQGNLTDACGLFERSGDISLPPDARNCYGGIIYFGLGKYLQALPFLQAASKAPLDPSLKGIVDDQFHAATLITQNPNKTADDWQEIFSGSQYSEGVNTLLMQYLFKETDPKKDTMDAADRQTFLQMLSAVIADESIAMDPTSRNVTGGAVEFQLGHYDTARDYYVNALNDDGTSDKQSIRYYLAFSYAFLGQFDQADKIVAEGAAAAVPNEDPELDSQVLWKTVGSQISEMREDAGICAQAFEHMKAERFQEALDALSILHEKNKDNRDIIYNMARCNQGLGRYDLALEMLKPYHDSETGASNTSWIPWRSNDSEQELSKESRLYEEILSRKVNCEVRGINCFVDAILSPFFRKFSRAESKTVSRIAKALEYINAVESDLLPAIALGVARFRDMSYLDWKTLKDVATWKYSSLLSPKCEEQYFQNLFSVLGKVLLVSGLALKNDLPENWVSKRRWKQLREALPTSRVVLQAISLAVPVFQLCQEGVKSRAGEGVDMKKVYKSIIPLVTTPLDWLWDYFIHNREQARQLPDRAWVYFAKDVVLTTFQVFRACLEFESIEHKNLNWAAPRVTALKPFMEFLAGNYAAEAEKARAVNAMPIPQG